MADAEYRLPEQMPERHRDIAAAVTPFLSSLALDAPTQRKASTSAQIEDVSHMLFMTRADLEDLCVAGPLGVQGVMDMCQLPLQVAPTRAFLVVHVLVAREHVELLKRTAKTIAARVVLTPVVIDEPEGPRYECARVDMIGTRAAEVVTYGIYKRNGFDALLAALRVVLDSPEMTETELALYGADPRGHKLNFYGYNSDFVVVEKIDAASTARLGAPIATHTEQQWQTRPSWARLAVRLLVVDIIANGAAVSSALAALFAAIPDQDQVLPSPTESELICAW